MKNFQFRRITSVLLSILICMTVFPSGNIIVSAENNYTATFYIDKGSVVIDDSNAVGYNANGTKITVTHSSGNKYLITQHQDLTFSHITTNNISISGTQDITLKGVNISPGYSPNANCYALLINKNSKLKLTIDTYAKLSGGTVEESVPGISYIKPHGYAGLQVHESSSVEIYGAHGANNKDYLYATGGLDRAAGIGGGFQSSNYLGSNKYDYIPNAGDIAIYSGNIHAEAYSLDGSFRCGAGIGSGVGQSGLKFSSYKSIKIFGGIVEAYGGRFSAGIGGADNSKNNGPIVIKNAKISASGGAGTAIGGFGNGGVTIESGTVTVSRRTGDGKYDPGIIGMSSQKTYISGGNILNVSSFYGGTPTVSATDTRNVYAVTINLPVYKSKKLVESLNVTTNGQAYSYGGDSIYPSADKKLVLYLPSGETSVNFEYDGTSYNFVGNVNGTNTTLKIMQTPLSITGLANEYTYGDTVPTPTITGGTTKGLLTHSFKGRNGTAYNDSTPPTGAGEYTYIAVMAGDDTYYEVTATYNFKINSKNITFGIDNISDRTFTGSAIEPSVIVKDGAATLIKNKDYTLSHTNNISVGTATVSISGIGNYLGSTGSVSFNIVPKSFNFTVEEIPDQPYTGSAIVPDITVKDGATTLIKDTDYTVSYSDNIKVGNAATVSVVGIGNYDRSTASAYFKIVPSNVPYTVTYQEGKHGSISSSNENVIYGNSLSIIPVVTPNQGYSFTGWSSDGGTTILSDAMLAQTIITDDITYSAIYIMNGTISPTTASFDLNNPTDINAVIVWNNATFVTEVQSGGKTINAAYYEVTGNTIVFKKEYLQKHAIGSLILKIIFDKGSSAGLTIAITNGYIPQPSTTTPVTSETNDVPLQITDQATGITIDLSDAIMPEGVTSVSLGSSSLSQSGSDNQSYIAVFKLISGNASLGGLDNLVVYDLELLDQNGNPIKGFKGKIKVKIKIPSNMSGDLHVFWCNPDDNLLTDMNAVQKDEHLIFETTHFSYYAVAQLGKSTSLPTASGGIVSNPNTGDSEFPIIPIMFLNAVLVGTLIFIKKRLKRVK